jgi:hypothetical protein
MYRSHRRHLILMISVVFGLLVPATLMFAAENPNPGVLPPDSPQFGKTYPVGRGMVAVGARAARHRASSVRYRGLQYGAVGQSVVPRREVLHDRGPNL